MDWVYSAVLLALEDHIQGRKCTITEGRRARDTRHTIAYEIFFFFMFVIVRQKLHVVSKK